MLGRRKKNFQRHRKKQARKKFFKRPLFKKSIICIFVIIGLTYLFLFSPFFQIQQIQVKGQDTIKATHIQNVINQYLESRFSRSILLNFQSLEQQLARKLHLLKKVDIQADFPHSLIVTLKERKPCFVVKQESHYMLVDKEGVILQNTTTSKDLRLSQTTTTIELWPEIDTSLESQILDKEKWNKLMTIHSSLKSLPEIAPCQEIKIPSMGKVTFLTHQGIKLYFDLHKDVKWQITKLKTILQQKNKNEFALLKYIDLRYKNYIFTKDQQ